MEERIAELEKQLKERDEKIANLEQKIDALMRRLFEATSEKLPPSQDEGKEPGKPGTSSGSDAAPEEDAPKDKPRSKRKKGSKKPYPKNLPIIIDAIIIPDEVAADPDNWEQIGEDYQDLWDMTPAQYFIRGAKKGSFRNSCAFKRGHSVILVVNSRIQKRIQKAHSKGVIP